MTKRKEKVHLPKDSSHICENMSFTAAEAYKMLRTKLGLILPGNPDSPERKCRLIGVTSALRGEGKSTTAVNLAYTMAESKKQVLLIEADMRLPSIHKRLGLSVSPGLSELLTSDATDVCMQQYPTKNGSALNVIASGEIPPLPSELLESKKMKMLLERSAEEFDYVIVDLPPVTVVTDAISLSAILDGMLLVVRENYCDSRSLQDAMNQFRLANVRLLGVVMNESNGMGTGGSNYNYRYGSHYSKKYYYSQSYQDEYKQASGGGNRVNNKK